MDKTIYHGSLWPWFIYWEPTIFAAVKLHSFALSSIPVVVDNPDTKTGFSSILIELYNGGKYATVGKGDITPISTVISSNLTPIEEERYICIGTNMVKALISPPGTSHDHRKTLPITRCKRLTVFTSYAVNHSSRHGYTVPYLRWNALRR